MVMVTEETFKQISNPSQPRKEGLEGQVDEFKQALQHILSNDSLTPETQMQLYSQLFSRYQKLYCDAIEPTTVITKPYKDPQDDTENEAKSIKTESAIQEQWKHAILENMPKMYKSKARELIDILSKSQQVAVHDNNVVSINNKTLPQSNIVRLVHDV